MSRLIAIVGLPGAGKSVASDCLVKNGFARIYFGGLTMEKLKEKGLPVNESNERQVREALRQEHGMAAFATLNIPKIDQACKYGDVVIDGLYSWEEYLVLRQHYSNLKVIAIAAPPALRYARLATRQIRPLTKEEAEKRDIAQIENSHQAGPIAMADVTVNNLGSKQSLCARLKKVLDESKAS